MTCNPAYCHPDSNLAEIAAMMWEHGCGVIPVVTGSGMVTGLITDRDICIALGTRNVRASEVRADDVSPPGYFACSPDDRLTDALGVMAAQEVHRMPVTDANGKLVGMLSIDDIILRAGEDRSLKSGEIIQTLKALRGRRSHEPVIRREAADVVVAA